MSLMSFLTGCGEEYHRKDAYPFRRTDFAMPYLLVCALLAIGELLGFASACASAWWPFALFLLTATLLIGYAWSIPRWPYLAVLLTGFFLALYSESRRARVFDHCDYTSSPLEGEFLVEGRTKATKKYLSFDSSVDGVDIRVMIRRQMPETATNLTAQCEAATVPSVGDVWHCAGWLERKPRGERKRRTLWVCGRGSVAECVSFASESSLGFRLRRLREALSYNIGYGLSHDRVAADLDRAIVLGERTDLPPETLQMFADAGTVHVFAISGLHVGIIAKMLVCLLMSVFFFPLRWVAVPLTVILSGYVMMIEAPPSAVRAAVMSVVYYSAPMFFRRSDSLVSWSVTFVIFHVLNPEMLLKVGSLMSFLVMLGILLYLRWAEAFRSDFLTAHGVTVVAWLSGVAIAARVFERVTIGGLFANFVMIPIALFTVVLGILGSVAGFVSPWLASHFNNAAALLIDAMAGISWMTARIPYSNLVVQPWPLWMCAAWYAALIMTFWLIRSVYLHRKQFI